MAPPSLSDAEIPVATADKIEERMQKRGIHSLADLGRHVGLSRSMMSLLVHRKRPAKPIHKMRLAEVLAWPLEAFESGGSPPPDEDEEATAPAPDAVAELRAQMDDLRRQFELVRANGVLVSASQPARPLPANLPQGMTPMVVPTSGRIHAGAGGGFANGSRRGSDEADRWNAFTVTGDCWLPQIREGYSVVLDQYREHTNGQWVAYTPTDGTGEELLVRRFYRRGTVVELRSKEGDVLRDDRDDFYVHPGTVAQIVIPAELLDE